MKARQQARTPTLTGARTLLCQALLPLQARRPTMQGCWKLHDLGARERASVVPGNVPQWEECVLWCGAHQVPGPAPSSQLGSLREILNLCTSAPIGRVWLLASIRYKD